MNPKTETGKKPGERRPIATAYIVGKNRIQNELMASFIKESMGLACKCHAEIRLPPETGPSASGALLLLDCQGKADVDPWTTYNFSSAFGTDRVYPIFFNVHPDAGIETRAIENGIRGVFYRHESYKTLLKGMHAILRGEFWFSRKFLVDLILSTKKNVPTVNTVVDDRLTKREKEILFEIASGASNHEISKAFFISAHTVKSHIYSIYKKIRANNRFQASLWAAKNFCHHEYR